MRMSELFQSVKEQGIKPLDTIVVESKGGFVFPAVLSRCERTDDTVVLELIRLNGNSFLYVSSMKRDTPLPYTLRRWTPECSESVEAVQKIRYDLTNHNATYVQ